MMCPKMHAFLLFVLFWAKFRFSASVFIKKLVVLHGEATWSRLQFTMLHILGKKKQQIFKIKDRITFASNEVVYLPNFLVDYERETSHA